MDALQVRQRACTEKDQNDLFYHYDFIRFTKLFFVCIIDSIILAL